MPELAESDKDPDAIDPRCHRGVRPGRAWPEPATMARMPSGCQRGRGAVTNPAVRFESSVVSPFDDGWDTLTGEIEEPVKLATTLIKDATKSVIAWNNSPDLGFDRAVNPVSRLRAWLRLLLRPADARLSRLFARPGFRNQTDLQA